MRQFERIFFSKSSSVWFSKVTCAKMNYADFVFSESVMIVCELKIVKYYRSDRGMLTAVKTLSVVPSEDFSVDQKLYRIGFLVAMDAYFGIFLRNTSLALMPPCIPLTSYV